MKTEIKIDLHRIAKDVATHLGGDWKYARKNDPTDHYATIATSDDAQINFYKAYNSDRIEISGTHADREAFNSAVGYNKRGPSIGVSATKDAEKISADIERRLLPTLAPLLTACRERIAQANAHAQTTAQTAARVAAAIGGEVDQGSKFRTPDPNQAEINLYRSKTLPEFTTSIRVSGDSVTIDRLYLTADETIAVFQALIAARKGTKE